ncbi:MAG: transposase [Bdellovibrionales bacterium]|nr:transposase [Bdellovibrionales bacterium]
MIYPPSASNTTRKVPSRWGTQNLVDKFSQQTRWPNSKLGAGVKYMQKHWKGLTAFLRTQGPIDNNILEQQLLPLLNRKTSSSLKVNTGPSWATFFSQL